MTINATYKSRFPSEPTARYVQYDGSGAYRYCITNGKRYDIEQGTCTIDDLPPDVAMKAIERRNGGVWPYYVDWPL